MKKHTLCRGVFPFAVLCAAACSKPPKATPSTQAKPSTQAPPSTHHPSASSGAPPITLDVSGPGAVAPGSEIEILVRVRRSPPGLRAFTLTIAVPQGAALLAGHLRESITDVASPLVERRIRLRVDAVPNSDLIAEVDLAGPSYGVHAQQAYRFGRPEPKLPQPPRAAAPTVIGGKQLGNPIPLK